MNQIKVELLSFWGTDRDIANAAWTSSSSFQSKELKTDTDVERIITTVLTKPINTVDDCLEQHAVPFETVHFKFWLRIPISVDRQHMTHRIGSHNGMSGRYRTMPSEYLDIQDDIIDITEKVKDELSWSNPSNILLDPISEYTMVCGYANVVYQNIVKAFKEVEKKGLVTNKEFKRVREFYRGMLPQHNMTERITIMNLRSFANYQKLRNSKHAQVEIKQVAEMMLKEIKEAKVAPIAIKVLERNKWII